MQKFETLPGYKCDILPSQTVLLYRFLTIKLSSSMGVQAFYALPEIAFFRISPLASDFK